MANPRADLTPPSPATLEQSRRSAPPVRCQCAHNFSRLSQLLDATVWMRGRTAESGVLGDLKIAEVGFTRRGFVRPQHEYLAPMLGGVWAMLLTGSDMD